jgi:hypothetical protein
LIIQQTPCPIWILLFFYDYSTCYSSFAPGVGNPLVQFA